MISLILSHLYTESYTGDFYYVVRLEPAVFSKYWAVVCIAQVNINMTLFELRNDLTVHSFGSVMGIISTLITLLIQVTVNNL